MNPLEIGFLAVIYAQIDYEPEIGRTPRPTVNLESGATHDGKRVAALFAPGADGKLYYNTEKLSFDVVEDLALALGLRFFDDQGESLGRMDFESPVRLVAGTGIEVDQSGLQIEPVQETPAP